MNTLPADQVSGEGAEAMQAALEHWQEARAKIEEEACAASVVEASRIAKLRERVAKALCNGPAPLDEGLRDNLVAVLHDALQDERAALAEEALARRAQGRSDGKAVKKLLMARVVSAAQSNLQADLDAAVSAAVDEWEEVRVTYRQEV